MQTERFDIIIIGSGAGGGTIAHALAPSSRAHPRLERGDFVPQEEENWNPEAVWKHLRYRVRERWLDRRGQEFQPYTHYCVGGNTKFWGSVLYRLRREDFQAVAHVDGLSPAWPIDYDTLEPYYERAECLYQVRGQHGLDPTEPSRQPVSGTRPFRTPRAWRRLSSSLRGLACIPRRFRSGCCDRARRTAASCATPATRFRARSTRRATPTSAASGRCCSSRR